MHIVFDIDGSLNINNPIKLFAQRDGVLHMVYIRQFGCPLFFLLPSQSAFKATVMQIVQACRSIIFHWPMHGCIGHVKGAWSCQVFLILSGYQKGIAGLHDFRRSCPVE